MVALINKVNWSLVILPSLEYGNLGELSKYGLKLLPGIGPALVLERFESHSCDGYNDFWFLSSVNGSSE